MPLGSLITNLEVDLAGYERQLNEAYRKTTEWSKKVEALQTRFSVPGVANGRGGGANSGGAEAQDQRAQDQRDRGYRQIAAAQAAALKEDAKRTAELGKAQSLLDRIGLTVGDLGTRGFHVLANQTKEFTAALAKAVGVSAGIGIAGGVVAFGVEAIRINKEYEVAKIALAEVLSLTTKLKDEQGRVVTGTRAMRENYRESAALIQQVRHEAIKTTLSTQELLKNVEQTLGFALSGGATSKQGVSLIAQISNLSKSLGAQGEREQGFEVRALLTGQNVSRSRIGRALGISREDIQTAKDAGNILGFLNDKLKAGKPFLDDYAKSFAGITSTLSSKSMELIRRSTEETFGRLEKRLGNLNNLFSEDNLNRWSKALAEDIAQAADHLEQFASSPVWSTLQRNFSFLFFDPAKATERDMAAKNAARGIEQTAAEESRKRVRELQQDLASARAAAISRAIPRAEAAGFTSKMAGRFLSKFSRTSGFSTGPIEDEGVPQLTAVGPKNVAGEDDAFALRRLQERLNKALQQQTTAEKALTEAHARNERNRGKETADRLHRESNAQDEAAQKRREDAEKERVDVAQQLAKLHNDRVAQILTDAESQRQQARENIKDHTRLAAVLVGIDRKKASDLRELERDTAEQARGLARRVLDDQTNFAKTRVAIAKQVHDAERTAAKELRDLVRERTDAERNLHRAQIDRITTLKRLGREEERSGLTKQAESLFDRLGISKQLQQQFTREELGNFPDIKQASEQAELRTRQAVRELAAQLLQPGGTSGVLESLRGRGVEVFGPSFRQEAERLQVGTASLGEQDVTATRGEEALQRQRARNDAGRPIEEAQRRLQEVDRRGTDIRADLSRTIREASERFGTEVRQRADDLQKLGEEARKLRQEFADSHMVVRKDLAPLLARAAGVTPSGAQRQAAAEGASTGNLIINGLALHLDAKGQEALRGLTDLLREQALRTAPARR